MDHLPVPSNAVIKHFHIHFLAGHVESNVAFDDYPDQRGWSLNLRNRSIEFSFNGHIVQDEVQIGKFLQEWLYFNLLRQFGIATDATTFAERAKDGTRSLTSACLLDAVPTRLQEMRAELKSMAEPDLETTTGHLQSCLQTAWATLRWLVPSASPRIAGLCLSIAILGETLENMLRVVLEETPISLSVSIPWRIQPECDFGRPLLELMRRNGWCPHRLAHLDRDGNDSIGRLWYFANIQPPLHDHSHQGCVAEECKHLQIDQNTYATAHKSLECRCAFIGPDCHKLAEIVGAGGIPVVSLEGETVQIHEVSAGLAFVAISHVWADGMGNQASNTLPWCILHQLQRRVNDTVSVETRGDDNVPFWVDTLCLPRQPIELRRQGIANLSESFKQAVLVLVVDAYLQNLDSQTMAPMEIIARIASSNWTLRLWTFSEGRLARRILVQFRDRAVEPKSLVSDLENELVPSGSIAESVMMDTLRAYNATTTFDAMDVSSPGMLRSSLKTRSTSWKSDEALCLGYISGLDMTKLSKAEDHLKMQTFWSLIGRIPLGLAFSDAKTKIDACGYRWAPASLTGDLATESWLGPASHNEKFASLSPRGLTVNLPTLCFTAEDRESGESQVLERKRLVERLRPPDELLGPLEFKHSNGCWYHCVIERPWHQQPRSYELFEDSNIAILLADSLDTEGALSTSLQGLLITYSKEEVNALRMDPPQAQVHFHVSINQYTDIEGEYMDHLQKFADDLKFSGTTEINAVLDDREAAFNLIWDAWRGAGGVFDSKFIELAKRVHRHRGMREDVPSLIIYCCDYVVWLLRVGSCCQISGGEEEMRWCID